LRSMSYVEERVRRNQDGAALVEFALVLPLVLLLLMGMLDLGKAFNYWIDETHLAHSGARYAAVNRNPGPGASLQESIKSQADTPELEGALEVCITFPGAGGAVVGEPVRVKVSSTYTFLGFVADRLGVTDKTISSTSTMRLERTPTNLTPGCA
jgi:Flp pilus assembly pilin Flp